MNRTPEQNKHHWRVPPWLSGLVATLQGVRQLASSQIFCRGRLALILLDTIFETGAWVFLEKVARLKQEELGGLMDLRGRARPTLLAKVEEESKRRNRRLKTEVWDRIDECHQVRNRLTHVFPNEDVPSYVLEGYYETAIRFLNRLFDTRLDESILDFGGLLAQAETPLGSSFSNELIRATQEYYTGSIDDAIGRLGALIAKGNIPEAHYLLAICLKRKGRAHWQRAVQEIDHALDSTKLAREPLAHLERADLLGRIKRPADSLESLEQAARLGLDVLRGADFFALKARALRGLGRFGEALEAFEKALLDSPRHRAAQEGFVEVLLTLGRHSDALAKMEIYIRDEPYNSYNFVLSARARASLGDLTGALEDLDKAWELSTLRGASGDNRVLFTRAVIYWQTYKRDQHDDALASEALRKAEAELRSAMPGIKPGFRPRFRNFLVVILWEKGRSDVQYFREALEEARCSVRENRFAERNHLHLAYSALAVGGWEEACDAGKSGLEQSGQLAFPRIWCQASILLAGAFLGMEPGRMAEGLEEWKTLVATVPDFAPEAFDWHPVCARVEAQLTGLSEDVRKIAEAIIWKLKP